MGWNPWGLGWPYQLGLATACLVCLLACHEAEEDRGRCGCMAFLMLFGTLMLAPLAAGAALTCYGLRCLPDMAGEWLSYCRYRVAARVALSREERIARAWLRRDDMAMGAYPVLADALVRQGRGYEAIAVLHRWQIRDSFNPEPQHRIAELRRRLFVEDMVSLRSCG